LKRVVLANGKRIPIGRTKAVIYTTEERKYREAKSPWTLSRCAGSR